MKPVSSTIQVVLADDHELVRAGIRSLLNGLDDVQVIAEVSDGEELLALLESVHPDVVVSDITMPGMDGITAVRRIRQRHPQLKVIMLSMNDSAESIRSAIAGGANGYVRKDAPAFELDMALRSVMATGSYFGSGVTERLIEPAEPAMEDLLTERQIEILKLLAQGNSSKEIAFALGLSSKTVDVHRTRIMDRLQLNDVASLTLYAVRKGLVKP
jgi:two-component system, NarL family, nitrate/nitrite response regulator NarL